MTTRTTIAASALAAALTLGVAMPASAAAWSSPGQLRAEINQLDRRIDQAEARRIISRREAASLERQVDRLQYDYRAYARGGFSRGELASLNQRVDAVQRHLYRQANDGNRRPGGYYR